MQRAAELRGSSGWSRNQKFAGSLQLHVEVSVSKIRNSSRLLSVCGWAEEEMQLHFHRKCFSAEKYLLIFSNIKKNYPAKKTFHSVSCTGKNIFTSLEFLFLTQFHTFSVLSSEEQHLLV